MLRAATAAADGGGYSSSSGSSGCLDLLCPASVKGLHLPGSNAVSNGSSSQPSLQQLVADSSSSSRGSSLAELELAEGSKLQCRLVVAADGARSRIRELAGFRTMGWSYNQRGLVATVATAEPNDTAWQRFLPTGPLALLPVRDGYSNVVWTVTLEMARKLEACSSREFADAVNAALQQNPSTITHGGASTAAAGGVGGPAAAAAGVVLQGLGGVLSSAPVAGPLLSGAMSSVGGVEAEAGSGNYWRAPPVVDGWVGSSLKSFPLQLQHSGR